MVDFTQCSQYFHDVQLTGLKEGVTYYYRIMAANGTSSSDVQTFTTALGPGTGGEFVSDRPQRRSESKPRKTVAVLADMGHTNAQGTYNALLRSVIDGTSFAWHNGDISYADDTFRGVRVCDDPYNASTPLTDLLVCWNASYSTQPNGVTDPEYYEPIPAGELQGNQGSPRGGDVSPMFENNWDIWQQWLNPVTMQIPYMVSLVERGLS